MSDTDEDEKMIRECIRRTLIQNTCATMAGPVVDIEEALKDLAKLLLVKERERQAEENATLVRMRQLSFKAVKKIALKLVDAEKPRWVETDEIICENCGSSCGRVGLFAELKQDQIK